MNMPASKNIVEKMVDAAQKGKNHALVKG